jgi:hypothetical protein
MLLPPVSVPIPASCLQILTPAHASCLYAYSCLLPPDFDSCSCLLTMCLFLPPALWFRLLVLFLVLPPAPLLVDRLP